MSAPFEAVIYGRSFYRFIEIDKINALKLSKGKFDAPRVLSPTAKDEIYWWRQNILNSSRKIISAPTVDYIIHTDVSNLRWGAHDEDENINGRCSVSEKTLHINCLELLAIKLAIRSFLPRKVLVGHLRIMSDNSTGIAYINKQGGTQSTTSNQLTKDIWIICMVKGTHASAQAHILGKQNILADNTSRKFHDASEWMLSKNIFNHLIACIGMPEIDLFTSRLNKQLHRHASWMTDPDALYIDAMSISSENQFVYLLPPFSMIWPVLNKILESIKALAIAPMRPTQSWFNKLLEIAVEQPMIIESKYLQLPGTNQKHPLYSKLKLLAVMCTRDQHKQAQFRKKQSMSSMQRGEMEQKTNINTYSEDGKNFVVKGTTIQCRLIEI